MNTSAQSVSEKQFVPDSIEGQNYLPGNSDGVVLLNGNDVRPEPIDWLWNGWLAHSKVHILGGNPGGGKTTVLLSAAATVSVGGVWPDGSTCERGSVLIWSCEDGVEDTLVPRLMALGADLGRCYFVAGTRVKRKLEPFSPERDFPELKKKRIKSAM